MKVFKYPLEVRSNVLTVPFWRSDPQCGSAERPTLPVDIEMQPKFSGLSVGPEVTRRLQEEIQRAAGW